MEELLNSLSIADDIYNEIIKTNLADRRLVINEEITSELLERIILMIFKWNAEDKGLAAQDRKPIYIYLNSPGGETSIGSAILDAITTSKTPVITVGIGDCYSMCSYILMAGHERLCFPHSTVLLHDGSINLCTTGNKGKDIQKYCDSLMEKLLQFAISHSSMTEEYLESIKDREMYLWPEEAKEKGIIDKIIGVDVDVDYIL